MRLSPDQILFWQNGLFKLNATIVFTWALMILMVVGSALVTRRFTASDERSHWQNLMEIIVTGIEKQLKEVGLAHPRTYLPFLGTLFLFIAVASLCTIIPGYEPPTGSLSTTATPGSRPGATPPAPVRHRYCRARLHTEPTAENPRCLRGSGHVIVEGHRRGTP